MLAGGNNNYRRELASWFQAYREKNNKMKTKFKLSLDILKQITQGAHVPSDALGGSIMGMWRNGLDKELIGLYENIHHSYGPILIEELQAIIDLIDKENEELAKYFNTNVLEDIASLKKFESLCITYNRDKRDLIQKIYTKLPGLAHIGERVHGIHTQLVEVNASHYRESALRFIDFYSDFAEQILYEKSPQEIFISLTICLNYLEQYLRESSNIILEDFAEGIIEQVRSLTPTNKQLEQLRLENSRDGRDMFRRQIICFLENYFRAGGALGKIVSPQIHNLMNEFEMTPNATPKKEYSEVNKEGKVDKFLKDTVTKLFNCPLEFKLKNGKTSDKKNWFKENIATIVKLPSNMKDLEKDFRAVLSDLQTAINAKGLNYNNRGGGFDSFTLADKAGKKIKLKDLDEEFFKNDKNKDKVEFLITEIQDALNTEKKFKDLIDRNKSLFANYKKDDDDESSEKGVKSRKHEIGTQIMNAIGLIQAGNYDSAKRSMTNLYANLNLLNESKFKKLVWTLREKKKYDEVENEIRTSVDKVLQFAKNNSPSTLQVDNVDSWLYFLDELSTIFNLH